MRIRPGTLCFVLFGCLLTGPVVAETFTAGQLQPLGKSVVVPLSRYSDGEKQPATSHILSQVKGNDYHFMLRGIRRSLVRKSPLGALQVVHQDIFADGYRFEYDKPLTWLPATIKLGQVLKESGKVRWLKLRGGTYKLSSTGRYEQSLTCLGWKQIRLGGKLQKVIRLKPVTKVKFNTVSMTIEADCDYLPGTGIVNQTMDVSATFVGLFTFSETERLVWQPK